MAYRDELEAAQARIQSLEEELARLRAAEGDTLLPASRRLLDELRAERDRALAQADRPLVLWSTFGLPSFALGVVGMVLLSVAPRDLFLPALVVGVSGLIIGAILLLARLTAPSTREVVARHHRLKIAEAEAQAEIGARLRVAPPTKPRIAPALSDDDAAAEAEALAADTALDPRRLHR